MARVAVAVLLLATALSTGGCSVARLAYQNADWLVLRQIDDYVDLDPAQRERLAAVLAARLEAHRRNELPQLLEMLREARTAAADGLDADELERITDNARRLYRETLARTISGAVAAIGPLAPDQVAHLERRFAERDEDYREKYLPPTRSERIARRVERTVERIEHWTGRLTAAQRVLVESERNAMPDSAEAWLAYRTRMQARLVALLRERADAEAMSAFLTDWLVRLEERDPDLVRSGERVEAGIKHLVARVDASLDARQRAFLLERLDDYAASVASLLEPRTPAAATSAPHAAAARRN